MVKAPDIAVLVVAFKRPIELRNCLERLQNIGVRRLYVAADGPRGVNDEPGVSEVRRVVSEFHSRFDIRTRFAKTNQGCRSWVSTSIAWFFKQEAFGIVLEEDILLDRRFYLWCDDIRSQFDGGGPVMHVNAFFPQGDRIGARAAHLTKYVTSWGWASWRTAWSRYDDAMTVYKKLSLASSIIYLKRTLGCGWRVAIHYALALRMTDQNKLSSWAYRWALTIWANNGVAISPGFNLSRNIGSGPDATHTGHEGLDRYDFADESLAVSSNIDGRDASLDKQVFSVVARADSVWRLARMLVSTMVPNEIFFWVRKKFRS